MSGKPFHSSGDLLDPEIEPRSPALQAHFLASELPGEPSAAYSDYTNCLQCVLFNSSEKLLYL